MLGVRLKKGRKGGNERAREREEEIEGKRVRDKARKRRDQTLNEIDERFNAEVITKIISIIILIKMIRAERIVCEHSSAYI